jgi:hypothetical protein
MYYCGGPYKEQAGTDIHVSYVCYSRQRPSRCGSISTWEPFRPFKLFLPATLKLQGLRIVPYLVHANFALALPSQNIMQLKH